MIENRYIRYQKLSQYIKQKIPFKHFYSQHQWFLLNRRHTFLILKNNILVHFAISHAVDEHYIICVLYLLDEIKNIKNQKITYCDWSDKKSSHPASFDFISNQHLDKLHKDQYLFLRKVKKDYKISPFLKYIYNFISKS